MLAKVEQLKAVLGASANPHASEELLLRAAHTFGALPADLRLFYSQMNGSRDMTPLEHGAIRFWPIQEWKSVEQERASPLYAGFSTMPIVADHMTDCWWYAVDCSAGSQSFGAVYLID